MALSFPDFWYYKKGISESHKHFYNENEYQVQQMKVNTNYTSAALLRRRSMIICIF